MTKGIGIIILAAGLGTRMKSNKAKVLHEICGRPMIDYVVRTANTVAGSNVVVVVGHQAEIVRQVVRKACPTLFAYQEQQLGTGHAVLCALPKVPESVEHVVVLCGDVPLIQATTIDRIVADHLTQERDVSVLAVSISEPTGYGRMVMDDRGHLTAIVEESDADDEVKAINVINSGIYVIRKSYLAAALPKLSTDNAQNEVYLTDIVKVAHAERRKIGVYVGTDSNEIIGVNSQKELQMAERLMKIRRP